jgi:hypothetical protein
MIRRRVRKASSRIGHQCRIAARRAKACAHLDIDFRPGWTILAGIFRVSIFLSFARTFT